jgi:PKD repeat protein
VRKRRIAATAALLLSVGSLTPTPAHAATAGTTLYVNNASGAGCTDSGSGTEAAPYCTVQAAVAAVSAGETVLIEPGSYNGAVDVTHSGTATAPITIETATPGQQDKGQPSLGDHVVDAPLFTFNGASYVTVSGFDVGTDGGELALIEGSSHITLDSVWDVDGDLDSAPVVHVTGTSSYVTLSRSYFSNSGHTSTVQIDQGSSHDTLTTNAMVGQSGGFIVNGAPDTAITSNSIDWSCNVGAALTGASTDSTIENNVTYLVENHSYNTNCPAATPTQTVFEVDAAATSGTTLDYNIVFGQASRNLYLWNGVSYSDPSLLNEATGQGAHDISADPDAYPDPSVGSPVIDSANADAPGELSTDLFGNARVDDPLVSDTGAGSATYYDRGAVEYEDPLAVASTMDSQTGTAPAQLTATESVGTAGWTTPTSWTVDFGDGSAATTSTSAEAVQHTYTAPGTYTVTTTATDGYGSDGRGSASSTTTVWILASEVFHPVTLTRLLDTRKGIGTGGVVAPVVGGSTLKLQIDGGGPLPAGGITAVTLNLTETNATGAGYVSAYADGTTRPISSNLNYSAGETLSNQVIAPVGTDGEIDLANMATGSADLIADVAGYYGPGGGYGLETYGGAPVRLLDTRKGVGTNGAVTPVPAFGTLKLSSQYLAAGTVEVLNVTETNAKAAGYLTAYPDGTTRPGTANLNFAAGQTIANQVDVVTGSDGSIDFYNGTGGTVDVIADQLGSFTTAGGAGYTAITPVRLLDTRKGIGAPVGAVKPFGTLLDPMAGVDGLPSTIATVAANVTVVAPTEAGYVTAYPDFVSTPPVESTQNFTPGLTVANETTMGAYKGMKLYNGSGGSTQFVVDVFGYYN